MQNGVSLKSSHIILHILALVIRVKVVQKG